jgi:hypothetical protein
MRNRLVPLLAACLAILAAFPASAWDDHAQLGYEALAAEPWASEQVKAESLESFLEAEKGKLASLLAAFEARSGRELAHYPPLPPGLAFKGAGTGAALRAEFLAALRINPSIPLVLYAKPGAGAARKRPPLPVAAVDPFATRFVNQPFESLAEGEELSALEVLATASDEPDCGLDVGLYEDNGGEAGKRYGLGIQPFGNPALGYGSQAPFHMAFAHEASLIKLLAPFTQRGLADYRFRLFTELARLAFEEGRPYWGWRFAGWALHYVQDLCQPYHASLLPGLRTGRILALNAFGSKADKDAAMIFLSNRHSLVEDYAYRAVAGRSSALLEALAGPGAEAPGPGIRELWLYGVVSKKAYARGRKLDGLLVSSFPARYVADPGYDYGLSNVGETREFDPYAALAREGNGKALALDGLVGEIFSDLGAYSRAYAEWASR